MRWGALSRCLAELGHRVNLVTADYGGVGQEVDATFSNLIIHRLPSGMPKFLRSTLPIRGAHRIQSALRKTFWYEDEAQCWARHLQPKLSALVAQEPVDAVIVTGSPFHAMHACTQWHAEQKQRGLNALLIQDYRDPWLSNPMRAPCRARRERVLSDRNRFILEHGDAFTAVTSGFTSLVQSSCPDKPGFTLENGYNPFLLAELKDQSPREEAPSFIYIGSLTNRRDIPARAFLQAIRRRQSCLGQGSQWKVTFMGKTSPDFAREFQDLIAKGQLRLQPPKPQVEALQEVKAHHYALQFNSDIYPYLVSTKIYEHPALSRPTLSINFGGEVARMIERYGLGYSVDLTQDCLTSALVGLASQPWVPLAINNVQQFSHRTRAVQLVGYLEQLRDSSI